MDQYESSLKIYRDLYSVIDSAFIEGKTEGIEEGRQEGLQEGLQVGRQEGLQESKRDMAKLLKDNGAQVDFPNRIILDPTFLNSIKIKCVYDKMISGANNNLFIHIFYFFYFLFFSLSLCVCVCVYSCQCSLGSKLGVQHLSEPAIPGWD